MLRKIDHKKMGESHLGWLNSLFHFSFAEYRNPENIQFGVLRVINDDLIEAGTGFDTHPHRDMEIVSYVVRGQLDHGDSMGNKGSLHRGEVQYMSAGTGVFHSEHNFGTEQTRILQIWIFPDADGYPPQYGDYRFKWEERKNQWLHFVSGKDGSAPIQMNQDVNFYVTELDPDKKIDFEVGPERQAYLVQIEGSSAIGGVVLEERDAMEIVGESITIEAKGTSHVLVIEMKTDNK